MLRAFLLDPKLNYRVVKVLPRVLNLALLVEVSLALVDQMIDHVEVLLHVHEDVPVSDPARTQTATFHDLLTQRLIQIDARLAAEVAFGRALARLLLLLRHFLARAGSNVHSFIRDVGAQVA